MDDGEVRALRAEMPALERLVYLNTGTSGPVPRRVWEAERRWTRWLWEVGPADPVLHEEAQRVVHALRRRLAGLFGVQPEDVALTQSCTEGIGAVAAGLDWRPGERVLISGVEHPSGLIPWLVLQDRYGIEPVVLPERDGSLDPAEVGRELERGARLVCLSQVAWSTGARLPVAEVAALARAAGAFVLVDAAQGAGIVPTNLAELGCDAYAAPGQKWLLGPDGTGFLLVTGTARAGLWPSHPGWASVASFAPREGYELHGSAQRFEAATRHVPSLAGLLAAADLLAELGPERAWQRVCDLVSLAMDGLRELPGCRVLTPSEPSRRAGLITFTLEGVDPEEEAGRLYHEHRILLRWVPWPRALRVSLHWFNTQADCERLLKSLRRP